MKLNKLTRAAHVDDHLHSNEYIFLVQHENHCFLWFCQPVDTQVTIDMALYGRLELASHVSGKVEAQFPAEIKLLK